MQPSGGGRPEALRQVSHCPPRLIAGISPTSTMSSETDPLPLPVDGLALVYHDARHVRFLIEKGFVPAEGWDQIRSLPRNRVEAWRVIAPLRKKANETGNAEQAAALFTLHFKHSAHDLAVLFQNPNWKHAAAVGGHAWRGVTAAVANLLEMLRRGNASEISQAATTLANSNHNNGPVRGKVLALDAAIGDTPERCWSEQHAG